MLNKAGRIINTLVIKFFYHGRVNVRGFLAFNRDTKLTVWDKGQINIGRSVTTFSNVHLSAIEGILDIGDGVSFNRNCIVVCRKNIVIGKGCSFGPNVCIYDHDHLFNSQAYEKDKYRCGPIIIEDDCWIGSNVIILRNTHVGSGCVIGAGTVISGEIPAHSIVTSDRKMIIKPIEHRERT